MCDIEAVDFQGRVSPSPVGSWPNVQVRIEKDLS
jgi:hypothetical protein